MDILDKVVLDNSHKFVYCKEEEREKFSEADHTYPILIDGYDPASVYVMGYGLPDERNNQQINTSWIVSYHKKYYDFLIASKIMNDLMEQVDNDLLDKRMEKLLKFYCDSTLYEKFKTSKDLCSTLSTARDAWYESYIHYLKTLKVLHLVDLPLKSIDLPAFISKLKTALGMNSYFSIFLDVMDGISITSQKTVNGYINSDINNNMSLNILCDYNTWNDYYDVSGRIIQDNYKEVDLIRRKMK